MSEKEIAGATALVTGASRGFGRGIATALSGAGAHVVGVARDPGPLEELRAQLGGSFTAVAADAADPVTAGALIDKHRPRVLVLNAGATPLPRPVHHHTWQTFSRNWEVDVTHVFPLGTRGAGPGRQDSHRSGYRRGRRPGRLPGHSCGPAPPDLTSVRSAAAKSEQQE